MPELPTVEELYAVGRGETRARNPLLTDWNEGSNLDALTGAGAALADQALGMLVQLFAAHFVDTAEGPELDALAEDRFNLTRRAAAHAIGALRFTRGPAAGAVLIPEGTRWEADVGGLRVTVETTAEGTIPAGSPSVDVPARASVAGRGGNLAAGANGDVLDAISGHAGVTATNPERLAGGADVESDSQFRDRIRRYFQTLRKGTAEALRAGAMSVPGVFFAAIDDLSFPPSDGGYVAVYVGDPDGAGNEALAAAVQAELANWRAAGVETRVFAAEREEISLTMTVKVRRGTDRAALTTAIRAAVLSGYLDELEPGEVLYASKAESRAHSAGESVLSVAQTVPAGDRAPTAPYRALRVPAASLTLTFVEV